MVVVVECLRLSWRKEIADTQVALENIAYEFHHYVQGIVCSNVPTINRHPPTVVGCGLAFAGMCRRFSLMCRVCYWWHFSFRETVLCASMC